MSLIFFFIFHQKIHIELCHSRPTTYLQHLKKLQFSHFQIKHWNMLYHVHTCIAIFFHISYNSVSTHSINQINYYICFTKTVETLWLTKPKRISHYFWFHKMLLISHVSSRPNWYSAYAGCNQRVFFFSKNCYYFSDLEIQWPRNPELKSSSSQFPSNFMAPMGPLKSRLDFQPALSARGL